VRPSHNLNPEPTFKEWSPSSHGQVCPYTSELQEKCHLCLSAEHPSLPVPT
jgi:hypothetical protein